LQGVSALARDSCANGVGLSTPAKRDPRVLAGCFSLVCGIVILGGKVLAYAMTGSAAILSDALEGLTNVVAAAFSLTAIVFSRQPPDAEHPYGHGKAEHVSAVFEGGLIAIAAIVAGAYAVGELWRGPELGALNFGIALTVITGLANAALGLYLLRAGQNYRSVALVADGEHVLADFKTTLGVLIGLGLVWLTGWAVLDAITALLVAAQLLWTGSVLIWKGLGALLDREDPALLERVVKAFPKARRAGQIRLHALRAIRSGDRTHVDAHLIVPEFWSVAEAHQHNKDLESLLLDACEIEGDIAIHADPCERKFCRECDLPDCDRREAALTDLQSLTLQLARRLRPDPDSPDPADSR
jgi:cation diffusion facilitator family transporter